MNNGELSINIKPGSKFIFYGRQLPEGKYLFGKEFFTLNGKPFDLGIPIIRIFNFKEIDGNSKQEKKYIKWKTEFEKLEPFQFIVSCMNYYHKTVL